MKRLTKCGLRTRFLRMGLYQIIKQHFGRLAVGSMALQLQLGITALPSAHRVAPPPKFGAGNPDL
jgi:hypothetical protein